LIITNFLLNSSISFDSANLGFNAANTRKGFVFFNGKKNQLFEGTCYHSIGHNVIIITKLIFHDKAYITQWCVTEE